MKEEDDKVGGGGRDQSLRSSQRICFQAEHNCKNYNLSQVEIR